MRRMCGPSTPAAWQNNQQSRYVHGSNCKPPPANCELILGWRVVTGSREWLCWCQVGLGPLPLSSKSGWHVPSTQRKVEVTMAIQIYPGESVWCPLMSDPMMWILDPYFNFSICRGRIYALSLLLPACQVLHYIFKTWDGSGSTRSPAALATWAFERHFAVCLAVRFGIGATSPSPSWDSQAGYLWMEFSETKKEWRLILIFWCVMLGLCWQIWSWQCKNTHHSNTQGKSSMS